MSLKNNVRNAKSPEQFIEAALQVIGEDQDPNIIIPTQFGQMAEGVFSKPGQYAGKSLANFYKVSQNTRQAPRLSEPFYGAVQRGFRSLDKTLPTGPFAYPSEMPKFFAEITDIIKTNSKIREYVEAEVVANLIPKIVSDAARIKDGLMLVSQLIITLEKVPNLLANIDPNIVIQILEGRVAEGGGYLASAEMVTDLRKSAIFKNAITATEERRGQHVAYYEETVKVNEGWADRRDFELVLVFDKANDDVDVYKGLPRREYNKPSQFIPLTRQDMDNTYLMTALQNALLKHSDTELLPVQNWVKQIAEERGLALVS